MIPSTTNKLLVSEDWKKIYQSYRNADFKSYDFETLRRTMIAYLREHYPEEFNDYIDSSEYIALIDLIAYLGQNISFRIDLNARENFLETAERRDSVLRLASLINYNAKRNVSSSGFLKILGITTNDNVIDANGNNLANQTISWNDPTNSNWYQQFVSIINAAMPTNFVFGRPVDSSIISGIQHDLYRFNSANTDVPIFSFNGNINGTSMNFEIVSSTFANQSYVYEDPPVPKNKFNFIYKNDNQGNGSSNTGFFVHFKQGVLGASTFNIDVPVPNQLIGVNAPNINNSDVWLWKLNADNTYPNTPWTKVGDLVGNNIIYNSINNGVRNIYSVLTRENDQIDLSFSDGNFGNLPKGSFSLFYRQSNGLAYTIKPDQLNNINFTIPYTNKQGQQADLSIIVALQETVSNSVASESNADIKTKAPQNYYLQGRMVTAEDYNIAPLTASSGVLKIKSINRISSGVSKFFELSDVSGQYSHTNIFGNDGILYKQLLEEDFEFNFVNSNEILGVIKNQLTPVVNSFELRSFYLDQYPRVPSNETEFTWVQVSNSVNENKGYFRGLAAPTSVGGYTGNSLKYIFPGTLAKFIPPTGQYFLPNNKLSPLGVEKDPTWKDYIWIKVISVVADGYNNGVGTLDDGTGPISLTGYVPTGAIIKEIIPKFVNVLPTGIESQIVNLCLGKRNFGLSFDTDSRKWFVIADTNLDLMSAFSLNFQKNVTNIGKDNSWMIAFEWTGRNYKVRYRILNYVFESREETAFFVDKTKKNYDFVNNTVVKDKIKVLSVNASNAQTAIVSTTPVANVYSSIVATNTNATSVAWPTWNGTTITTILTFASTLPIEKNKWFAVHPSIGPANGPGAALVIDTSTTAIQINSTLTSSIVSGSKIVFMPNTITVTTTTVFSPSEVNQTFSISKDYNWQVDSAVIEPDGYINSNKVKISFYDIDDDGQIDDPDSFEYICRSETITQQTGYKDKFVFFKKQADGLRYKLTDESIFSFPTEDDANMWYVENSEEKANGQLFYFYDVDINVVKSWNSELLSYDLEPDYFAYYGRSGIKFHYVHNSGQDRRLDPSKTNLIDIYLLTKTYDTEYRNWLANRVGDEPMAPTSQGLEESFAGNLESIKSISDELVFQPTQYKVLFGDKANTALQATFKAVRNSAKTTSDNDLKTRILVAIEEFFSIENWDFGDTFYFSELSTYVMNKLTPDITNFVIVPKSTGTFGSLFEVTCQSNEIFINGATVNDIEIIDSITASELKTSYVVTSSAGV